MIATSPELLMAAPVTTWSEILADFWPAGLIAFAVSLAATPLAKAVALRYGIVDRPDAFLKPHGKPIPYLGGAAIFLGWLAGLLAMAALNVVPLRTSMIVGIALAGGAIMLVGLFDDMRVMSPRIKLLANVAVALLLLGLGLGTRLTGVLTDSLGVRFDAWLELAYSVPLMMLIVVGACNATNLIDGLDGLCAGVLGIIGLGFFLLAGHVRLYAEGELANERLVLAAAMLGSSAGFLPFNRNPAKIFMGDAGSMLLGLNAAVLILMFAASTATEQARIPWMLGALMVFGLPIGDMLLTLARRWRNGKPLMIGDRSHFYDQLRDRGMSVKRVVAISYLLTLGFVLVGTSVMFLRTRYAILVYLGAAVLAVAAVTRFRMVSLEHRPDGAEVPGAGDGSQ